MALRISGRAITSDMTPETAHLVPGPGGGTWALSWLPGWDLTQDQAIDGMALDEILSDPEPEDQEWALEMAALRAESLGMELEDVVVRLCARVIERDRRRHRQEGTDRPPAGYGGRSDDAGDADNKAPRVARPHWVRRVDAARFTARGIVVGLLWAGYTRRSRAKVSCRRRER